MTLLKRKRPSGIRIIKKSNELIEARYRFDIWETRLFLSVLSCIQKDDQDLEPHYRIWYKDVIKFFGLKSHQSYDLLRDAAKSLMSKQFYVNYKDKGFTREKAYQIIITADYLKGGQSGKNIENQEYIDVSIHPEMKPLLLQLVSNFTRYDFRNVARLSANPVRLYELLKQYETLGERVLQVDYIRRIMEFQDEYSRFSNFYQAFIKPGVNEINKHTDLTVYNIEKVKQGRTVVALHFFFKAKEEDELNRIRGNRKADTQLPLFSIDKENGDDGVPMLSAELEEGLAKVNDWWGVERGEFLKRVDGKNPKDVEGAIEFTKSKIRIGKAANPAGVFLDALSRGHKTVEQHRGEKKAKLGIERQKQLESLKIEHERLADEYRKEVNKRIRAITEKSPEETGKVIDKLKSQFQTFQNKTIDDFREDATLRDMVKSEIMANYPKQFESLKELAAKVNDAKNKILRLSHA